jgi:hypothetical protein
MTWVVILKPEQASWQDYERVSAEVGETPPAGLIIHAAGEVDGRWRAVSVWESQSAYESFRDQRVLPAVAATLGDAEVAAGPPPSESFEVKHAFGELAASLTSAGR